MRLVIALVAMLAFDKTAIAQIPFEGLRGDDSFNAKRALLTAQLKRVEFYPSQTIERYLDSFLAPIRAVDQAGDGLDAGDIELRQLREDASLRANYLIGFFGRDLNDDLRLTADELKDNELTGDLIQKHDADRDGTVTFDEALKSSRSLDRRVVFDGLLADVLQLDPDKDGRLTVREAETIAREKFAKADKDGNGQISESEAESALPR